MTAVAAIVDDTDKDIIFRDGGHCGAVSTFWAKFNNPSIETLKGIKLDVVEFKTLLKQESVFKQKIKDLIESLNPLQELPE